MIRFAETKEDVQKVAEFMTQFQKASEFVKVNVPHTVEAYWNLITQKIAVFMMLEHEEEMIGGLGAIKYPDMHDGKLTAVETFWFISPDHRGAGMKLFNAFEQWGKDQGCKKLAMIHLSDSYPEILEKIYMRKGYKLAEKHYIKEI